MDKKQLKKTATLARLTLSEEEERLFADQLAVIFDYFKQISSQDTKGIKPLVYPLEGIEQEDLLREDQVQEINNQKQLLDLAPEKLNNEYKVPPVVES